MKKLAVLCLCVLFTLTANSQCDTMILGKWKVISVKTSELYFNLKTDSSFIESDAIKNYPDTNRQMIIELNKMSWGNIRFEFKKGNQLTMQFMEGVVDDNMKFCFNDNKKLISITSKNSLGEDKTDDWSAYMKEGQLHMTIQFDPEDDESKIQFVFERYEN
ncbi:hypothetical protein [Sediminibacterium goheungense]|uniref:Lipocalin-like protein n=1 Tax=Sediminibacterium goheungense TaxID=1086393 RepID=A0A4R6IVQ7_9BACT|nr:hypothetical protein [Sediminibacterium goheungense]TDO26769.1 hypothetical protein BC659_2079 [Sediminibacterium goheungense]